MLNGRILQAMMRPVDHTIEPYLVSLVFMYNSFYAVEKVCTWTDLSRKSYLKKSWPYDWSTHA